MRAPERGNEPRIGLEDERLLRASSSGSVVA
jgi:hypothetical protein